MTDNNKICFIMCTDNERYEQEATAYISRLNVPEGMSIDLLSVKGALSMCAGYNEAMNASDAKYKIYLHQDTFIVDTDILTKLLNVFKDEKIGLVGAEGVSCLTTDMEYEHGEAIDADGARYYKAAAVGGYFMATSRDIPWREDLFDGWDFYEISQCAEFTKAGLKVVALSDGNHLGIVHIKHRINRRKREKYRLAALREYGSVYKIKPDQKKVALFYSSEITFNDIAWGLLQTNYDVSIVDTDISVHSILKSDAQFLEREIQKQHADVAITFDFCPALSDACRESGIKYAAWIYDAPQKALYEHAIRNDCNYIFSFDKYQIKETIKSGAKHVYHLPLAGNVLKSRTISITPEDKQRFSCEVSFIGNLYTDHIYGNAEAAMSEATKKEYNAIIEDAYNKWDGVNRINDRLSDAALNELRTLDKDIFSDEFVMDFDEFFGARLIARYLAHKERIEMLKLLAKYDLKFFTSEKNITIPNVKIYPGLRHDDELMKAYALSKININTTLHSITSGIPLRVFEIMSMGGFVLSNYQPEIEEFFEIGKELEVYHSLEEMDDKVRFYLSNDRLRQNIALKGQRAVERRFSYEIQVSKIMDIVLGDKG